MKGGGRLILIRLRNLYNFTEYKSKLRVPAPLTLRRLFLGAL